MVLLSFELEVISNKSSSLVGEICELHIVLSHQRTFLYELLNFGKGAGNKSVVNWVIFATKAASNIMIPWDQ